MKTFTLSSLMLLLLSGFLLVPALVSAQESATKEATIVRGEQVVTVSGKNFCYACALAKGKKANAQCSAYGHRHALKVSQVHNKDGQELPKFNGWTLHYLDNDKSKDFVSGHHEEQLHLKGKIYAQDRVLEVISPVAKKAEGAPQPGSQKKQADMK